MRQWWRFGAVGILAAGMMLALGTNPGMAQSRAHVYLLRGLMNIFSLGMDTMGEELSRRGVSNTVTNYSDWQSLADGAAARYRAGTEGPIILVGHSLGADAVMQMAAYLGNKGIPVALVVPFDCTSSFSASSNVARVINFTKHYYMSRGPGFHGSLVNVDLRGDPNIDHLNIEKSPRLHARVIGEIMSIVGARRSVEPTAAKPATGEAPASSVGEADKTGAIHAAAPAEAMPARSSDSAPGKPVSAGGETPVIAAPEKGASAKSPAQ